MNCTCTFDGSATVCADFFCTGWIHTWFSLPFWTLILCLYSELCSWRAGGVHTRLSAFLNSAPVRILNSVPGCSRCSSYPILCLSELCSCAYSELCTWLQAVFIPDSLPFWTLILCLYSELWSSSYSELWSCAYSELWSCVYILNSDQVRILNSDHVHILNTNPVSILNSDPVPILNSDPVRILNSVPAWQEVFIPNSLLFWTLLLCLYSELCTCLAGGVHIRLSAFLNSAPVPIFWTLCLAAGGVHTQLSAISELWSCSYILNSVPGCRLCSYPILCLSELCSCAYSELCVCRAGGVHTWFSAFLNSDPVRILNSVPAVRRCSYPIFCLSELWSCASILNSVPGCRRCSYPILCLSELCSCVYILNSGCRRCSCCWRPWSWSEAPPPSFSPLPSAWAASPGPGKH